MATDTIYHYTFTYNNAGGGDKGGTGDWYRGYTIDTNGLYKEGQTYNTDHGSYKIDKIDHYNVDLHQAHGNHYEAKSVYITTYHDSETGKDYKPYRYEKYEGGDYKSQSGHGGLGSEQDYVKTAGKTDGYGNTGSDSYQYHNFGGGGEYSYGGAKPDSKYSFTYHDKDSGSYYKGWMVDDADHYSQGQRVDTSKGWYTIDKEEAVSYNTGWHPEPKDYNHDNGYVHITEYYRSDTGKTYHESDMYSHAKGDGYASGYQGFGSENEYCNEGGQWYKFADHGDVVW